MYKVKVRSHFSSAHNLRGYKGKCEDIHGHNWKIEVCAMSEKLNNLGMVMDFTDLKKSLEEVLNGLDHKYLNELDYFKKVNPTSECIAEYIYDQMVKKHRGIVISEVTVWETDTSSATYMR
jgi:6-pyruvoyltetrahydropterin/6-carboxytetrahydropterin synthase